MLESTRQLILSSEAFVLEEVTKLQYLYQLKHVIRYDRVRNEDVRTESVAEHVFSMQLLADYFLPLEDTSWSWNKERIYKMVLWHDMDEIETGDVIGYLKTDADRAREKEATQVVLNKLPQHLIDEATSCLSEYEAQSTNESKFVKAIDKIEPSIQSFNENGKRIFHEKNCTLEQHRSIKDPFVADFPYIQRFSNVITAQMEKQGFFVG